MRSASSAAESRREARPAEAGATLVEFLAVSLLTVVCLLAVAQMAVWVWARNVAVSAVHEGARTAAETGRPVGDGTARARMLLADGLGGGGRAFVVDAAQKGDVIAVRAHGRAPVIAPFLPAFEIDVRATAYDEDRVLP